MVLFPFFARFAQAGPLFFPAIGHEIGSLVARRADHRVVATARSHGRAARSEPSTARVAGARFSA